MKINLKTEGLKNKGEVLIKLIERKINLINHKT